MPGARGCTLRRSGFHHRLPATVHCLLTHLHRLSKVGSDAVSIGGAYQVRSDGEEALPFLALPLPFCQRLTPFLAVLQFSIDQRGTHGAAPPETL